ncbi:MAG: PfkB family carbohydrate kinase [Candidatus Dormibacteraceae bacterium]
MPDSPRLLVAGSIALDTLEGPWGTAEEELGGSALYFALAASLFTPVALVAPVGIEEEDRVRELLEGRRVDLAGLAVIDAATYRWHSRRLGTRDLDLGSQDGIYDAWTPATPPAFRGWAFVGSMRPGLQLQAAARLRAADLLAGDAMRSYVRSAPVESAGFVAACDWFFCTVQELSALGGDPAHPEAFRLRHGLRGLVVKAGPAGLCAYTERGPSRVPALTARPVRDPTGAGDALAGGMLACWQRLGGGPEALWEALAQGVACASVAISEVGLRGLAAATLDEVMVRARDLSPA